uniref:Imidazole glycerol phosphate synthase subunit HisH n=1 Tax=uncultured Thiotrichaceae bacterium TaxID=298394 RepID=A0A6S6S9A4_9GAMM|nr:MAG: Imidazole glycerol phosphate synthase amidotransferase subunit (EC [uncultured Thiotrichaceae bacterium]
MQIAIVDYNMGNLHSVQRAVQHCAPQGATASITADADFIRKADRVVFPGQGAARDCMRELQMLELDEVVHEVIKEKPFLGICMGMQVLMQHSEENDGISCMSVYPGDVRYFGNRKDTTQRIKIPQMGWNQIWHKDSHPLWNGIEDGSRFYFVHSYYVDPQDKSIISGETEYGTRYASAIAKDNVFAIQAHPEKSADDGLRLLSNFMSWNP